MTYDGEHGEHFRIYGGPFDVQPAPGRTDQLVCYATSDAVTFQVAQNLGVQHQYQYGPLRAMYPDFSAEHRAILARHGLDGVVDSSAWVFQHANLEDTLEDHESMIRNLAEKWGQDSLQPDMGVIADMNRLVRRSMQEIVARREEIMRDYPEEVEKLRRA
ncbi:hypothetical protein COV82_06555 [Candidatus Peregrinibacteria bacterium CG11_big_fil_rev_8_21_14_0_20_46_8]|nr:MAG: hypothetical protein COV82_06555 [Candidatus Peregrinibacteria bacterium CG11_big_fil_rev_8_21_14_0_20_46_8]